MVEQHLERHAGVLLQRLCVGQRLFRHAHAVDDEEVGLGLGVWGDGAEFIRADDADATALHLLEQHAGVHAPHEHDDLDRLDVRPRGDQDPP